MIVHICTDISQAQNKFSEFLTVSIRLFLTIAQRYGLNAMNDGVGNYFLKNTFRKKRHAVVGHEFGKIMKSAVEMTKLMYVTSTSSASWTLHLGDFIGL